jgi:hypothetical protein
VVLRLAPLELAGHLGDRLGHLQAPSHQVHSPGAQGGELAEPQAGVGQDADDQVVLTRSCLLGEHGHLVSGQEPLVRLGRAG